MNETTDDLRATIRAHITHLELLTAQNAEDAQAALDARNYSSAATWSHRAHQTYLQVQQLRSVLGA